MSDFQHNDRPCGECKWCIAGRCEALKITEPAARSMYDWPNYRRVEPHEHLDCPCFEEIEEKSDE